MKAIRKVLFFHGDDDSLGPMFKAIFQKKILDDPVLVTAGLMLDSVGNGSEGESLQESLCSALSSMRIQDFAHTSKNIWLHPDLVRWADLILVPSLFEEDFLCLNFVEAGSKTIPVGCYCGQYHTETQFHVGTKPWSEDECRAAAETYKTLLPSIVDKIKDSYANALIASGISINKGIAIGKTYIAKRGRDLQDFPKGDILIIDKAGTVMYKDIDSTLAASLIRKFVESAVMASVSEVLDDFVTSLEGKTKGTVKWTATGLDAFRATLSNAKALICSRGRHDGEHIAIGHHIPCISSCVGATEYIANGQVVVVDAGRGEVYDASLLQELL